MTELKIAQLGEGLTEVLVVGLLASAGAEIARDQPLLEVETDKAVMTIEAPGAGRLVEWRVKGGERVAVGEVFAVIDPVAGDITTFESQLSQASVVADLISPGDVSERAGVEPGVSSPTGTGEADRAHFAPSVRAHSAGANGHAENGHPENGYANGHSRALNGSSSHQPGANGHSNGAAIPTGDGPTLPPSRRTRNGELSPRERARLKSTGDGLEKASVTPAGAEVASRGEISPLVFPEVPGVEAIAGVEVEIDPALEAASNLELEQAPVSGGLTGRHPSPYFPTDRQVRLRTAIDMSSRYTGEATISSEISWDQVVLTRRRLRSELDRSLAPLAPEVIAWSAVRALRRHARFRLINGGQKGYFGQDSVCFGMAVALPDDELGMATVENADTLTLGEFIAALRQAIRSVKSGVVSPGRAQFHLSYMATHGVDYAIPRVVYPAVATLFVGAAREVPRRGPEGQLEWSRAAHFVLSFDHHVINGAGAARFLRDVATGLGDIETGQS